MATIGDNRPPEDINPLADRLADDYRAMVERTADLVEDLARAPAVVDESNFDRSGAFVRQLRDHAKLLEATRENEKKAFLEAGRTVDGFFKKLTEQLTAAATAMEGRIRSYLQAKERAEREVREAEARRQREEQERLEAEAQRLLLAAMDVQQDRTPEVEERDLAAAIAADEELKRQQEAVRAAERAALASAADLARTRSAIAGTATLVGSIAHEVTNREQALLALLPYISAEALDETITAFVRTWRATGSWKRGDDVRQALVDRQPLKGVRFFLDYKARVV